MFDEDLQKKIEENERLHIQVSCQLHPVLFSSSTVLSGPCIYPPGCVIQFYEADELHKQQEAELRARLQELEKESEQHQAVINGLNTKYTDTIERLQSDKARLEVRGINRMKLTDVS